MNEIAFQADMTKHIVLTEEEQREYVCEQFDVNSIDSEFLKNQVGTQPFILPSDVMLEENIILEHNTCSHRYLGEYQMSGTDFQDPKMVPAHLVIFDSDTIGVMIFQLQSFSIHKRMKEDLSAKLHQKDLLQLRR